MPWRPLYCIIHIVLRGTFFISAVESVAERSLASGRKIFVFTRILILIEE